MSFRDSVNRHRIDEFLNQLGKRFRGAGQVYLVGGTTMVYEGFRTQMEMLEETFREILPRYAIKSLREILTRLSASS